MFYLIIILSAFHQYQMIFVDKAVGAGITFKRQEVIRVLIQEIFDKGRVPSADTRSSVTNIFPSTDSLSIRRSSTGTFIFGISYIILFLRFCR